MAGLASVTQGGIRTAQVAGGLSGFAAAFALAGWAYPPVLDAAIPIMVLLFVLAAAGMILLVAGRIRRKRTTWKEFWSRPLPPDPFRFFNFLRGGRIVGVAALLASAITGLITAASALAATGGYSQNPAWTIPQCEWSIGTNHGATNLCVSHARWLATGQEFQRAFIGFLAIFLAVESLVFLAQTVRAETRASRAADNT